MIVTFNVYNTQYKCTLIRFQFFYKMMLTEQKHWKLIFHWRYYTAGPSDLTTYVRNTITRETKALITHNQ